MFLCRETEDEFGSSKDGGVGRDAVGLLSGMTRVPGWRWTGPPPVVMSLRQPGGEVQRHPSIHKAITKTSICVCVCVCFIPAEPSVALHIYGSEMERSGLVPS